MVGLGQDELSSLPLLDGATADQLARLRDCMSVAEASAGEVLGREGEPGEVFWLLIRGRVEVWAMHGTKRRSLARAGPGSILGELAVLRDRPRTATVTAVEPCRFACGDREAMERLLAIEPVRRRLSRLASTRLAQDVRPVPVALEDGGRLLLRPLLPSDRDAIDAALHALSRQTLRLRFFSTGPPSEKIVDYLVDIDYVDHFAWVALDAETRQGEAVARYVRPPGTTAAEMAFTTADRAQGRGIGTILLGALGVAAGEAGIEELFAYALEDNRAMRAVFAKVGAAVQFDEPGIVQATVDPRRAAALLDESTADALASAVHDVVTAASLALA